jgi:hypothetical protein
MAMRARTIEVVQQVDLDLRYGRAEIRAVEIDTLEGALPQRRLGRQSAPEYPLDDIDVRTSAIQRTLVIDLSALEKGHKSAGLHAACLPQLRWR